MDADLADGIRRNGRVGRRKGLLRGEGADGGGQRRSRARRILAQRLSRRRFLHGPVVRGVRRDRRTGLFAGQFDSDR